MADMTLDELMVMYGTDKGSSEHGYAQAYEDLLATFRWRSVTLLEIGAGQGGSLKVWKHYLPNARVYGIDVEPASLEFFTGDGVFIGNQADPTFLASVLEQTGAPDVVIDDGGHRGGEQIISFQEIFPKLRSEGIYVVEDTHTWYQDAYDGPAAREFFLGMVDAINIAGVGGTGSYETAMRGEGVPAWSGFVHSAVFFQSLASFYRR